MPTAIRVLIAQNAGPERSSLQAELQRCSEIQVVAMCGDVFTALEGLQKTKPDVVLLDLDIHGGGSQALIQRVVRSHKLPIIALFTEGGEGQVSAAQSLALGATDTQPKTAKRSSMQEFVGELSIRIFRVANHTKLQAPS
ncbi:MAG: response regulator, partial [Planctomycetes bacterium]|nr:response regulator [Planctomycetota bacterium]